MPIVNYRGSMSETVNYRESELIKELRLRREQDARDRFKNSYRLLCRGVVIGQSPKRLGEEFGIRSLQYYRNNLQSALNSPITFKFIGAGGEMYAAEYLDYHSRKLGMTIVDDFLIVDPGEVYPLAPKWENII